MLTTVILPHRYGRVVRGRYVLTSHYYKVHITLSIT